VPVPEPRWRTGAYTASDPDSDSDLEPVAVVERRPRVTVVSYDEGAPAREMPAPQAADAGPTTSPLASSTSGRADDPASPDRT
jgi:hypothetical protein